MNRHRSDGLRIDWAGLAMLGGAVVLWAGNSIVGRAVRADIDPVTLACLRWCGASLVVLPFAWRGLKTDIAAIRAAWMPTLVLCLTGVAGFNTFLYAGLRDTTATNALLLQALIPGLVLLLGAVALHQREDKWKVVGIAFSMLGAAVTVFRGDLQALLQLRFGHGDVFVFAACVVWAVYTLVLRFAPRVRATSFLFVTFSGGALLLLPLALFWPDRHLALNAGTLAAIGYVSILPSVIAYLLYNLAVARIGAAVAGQAITLMPLIGAGLAALLLGEALHWYHALGMGMILVGVVLAQLARSAVR